MFESLEDRFVLSADMPLAAIGEDVGVANVSILASDTAAIELDFNVRDDWGSGFVADLSLTNNGTTTIEGWQLVFDFPHDIGNIWSAEIASRVGDQFTIEAASWNQAIAPGQTVGFGFQGSPGNVSSEPANVLLNGAPIGGDPLPALSVADVALAEGTGASSEAVITVQLSEAAAETVSVSLSTVDGTAVAGSDYQATSALVQFAAGQTEATVAIPLVADGNYEIEETFLVRLSNPVGAVLGDGEATVTIQNDDAAPDNVTVSVADVSAVEGDVATAIAPGFFHTEGNQIVDSAGNNVRIAGVNWFGLETNTFAPHGLWTSRSYQSMMDQMRDLGFNTIRLPFSNQLFDAGSTPNGINFFANPDLEGLSGLEIMDKIVDYADEIGLRIILDNHRSSVGGGPEGNGLWYTSSYSEQRWIDDWTMLAERYAGNPTVIGADIRNEPHAGATWGDGNPATDWRLAAEKAGNAILGANSDWLIFVEGIQNTDEGSYWWGGNLSEAGEAPVELDVPGRLVYSPHAYPASVFNQDWFSDPDFPNNLPEIWDDHWGYLFRQDIAPIMLGEFGSRLENPLDEPWIDTMIQYISGDLDGDGSHDLANGDLGISWTFWSWNPNSSDTGGILNDDWTTVRTDILEKLQPVQFEFPDGGGDSAPASQMNFTISLSEAHAVPVTVDFTTANGTAIAGSDYNATSGSLTFQPGETEKTVSVAILGDELAEEDENLFLRLTGATNAQIVDAEATGTIVDDDGSVSPPPPPVVPDLSIGDVTTGEGDAGSSAATFTVALSEATTETVTLNYMTANGSATAGSDYAGASGTLTFAPGETVKTIAIDVLGDVIDESDETFLVNLSDVSGANLVDGQAVGTILDDDEPVSPPPPPVVPDVSIDDVTITEGDSGNVSATFTVTLSEATAESVTVDYMTGDDTALAGSDYSGADGTLTFAPGETTQTISIDVLGDLVDENIESFQVNLSDAAGATIVDGQGIGTILDDDVTGEPIEGSIPPPVPTGDYIDLMTWGMFHSSDHTGHDQLMGGRTPITTEALFAYNALRGFFGMEAVGLEEVGQWAFANQLTNNTEPYNNDILGVGLWYSMQGAKIGWIRDDAFDPQISADVQRTARLGDPADVMAMVRQYGHVGFADYLETYGVVDVFISTLKMEPHYAGWMHGRAHGRLSIEGVATAHDVNHLTVLSHDQTQPFMNDTFDYPQWPALEVSHPTVIEYFQSMVELGDPLGQNLDGSVTPMEPTLSVADVEVTEGDDGTTATVTVQLDRAAEETVTVDFATADGTAIAGEDYEATSGTLTFAPGERTKTIAIAVVGDDLFESDEAFDIVLSQAVGADLGDASGLVTILDDDASVAPVTVDFNVASDWGSGFVGNIAISNGLTTPVDDWVLEFDFAGDFVNIWNAEIVSHVGDHYVIRNAGYNGTIGAGQTVTFGFQATPGNVTAGPTNFVINGAPVASLSVALIDDVMA
ncbi:Calx-beta domain-containing protein [Kolteria novifilia]